MKKIILIMLSFLTILTFYKKVSAKENIKIPDSAIRFRVLANSNSPRDQKIKEEVRDKMQKQLYDLLKETSNIKEARTIINKNMNTFDNMVKSVMKDKNYSYEIDYGLHEFPQKKYKGVTYDAGYYESLLVTLGEGKGDNWWCVLFPPLCLMEAEEKTDTSEVEYKSFIKEILEKYF